MVSFIDEHRDEHGVGSICTELPIAPSTYYELKSRQINPDKEPDRVKRDNDLKIQIQRVWDENFFVYGARKVWRQLNREKIHVARCTVARLMRLMGLKGAIRGKRVRTTISDDKSTKPLDLVNRNFTASRPNQLWIADFTYVATWRGFVYVAFVIDVFSRMIVGWRVSRSMNASLTLDALDQAIFARSPTEQMIHHSDRGVQYLSIRYSERLSEAGIEPSAGSVGDSYDNAMAETIIGLFKTEIIHRRGPWKTLDAVEYATLEWVDWFNNRRILEPIGNIPPVEFEMMYYSEVEASANVVGLK